MLTPESVVRTSAALFLAASLAASTAGAQDEEQTALARSLFSRGVELSDAGAWPDAAEHFRRSLELRWSPVVAFNLGTALAHVGELVSAQENLRQALRDEGAPDRLRAAAEAQLAQLAPRIATLTLATSGAVEGVTLELDGRALPEAAIGVAAPADPGRHVLVARRGEREVARAEIEVPEGGEALLAIEVPAEVPLPVEIAEPAPLPAAPAPAPAHDDTLVVALAIAGGVLALGIVAAIVAALVIEGQGHGDPVDGNLGPAIIVFE